jgi:hypothetical protein
MTRRIAAAVAAILLSATAFAADCMPDIPGFARFSGGEPAAVVNGTDPASTSPSPEAPEPEPTATGRRFLPHVPLPPLGSRP